MRSVGQRPITHEGNADSSPSVVLSRPDGRRLEVVELAMPRRPGKGADRHRYYKKGQWEDEEDDAHETPPVPGSANVRPFHATRRTVSELVGIITAATSGLIRPSMARVAPTTL